MIAWFLSSRLGRAVIGAVVAIASLATFALSQRKRGAERAEMKRLQDASKKRGRANEAANELRGADRDELNDRLHRNDGHW
jgi:Flp pilus assembly protein TadB